MNDKEKIISKLKEIADHFDNAGSPGKGAEIRQLMDEINTGKRDPLSVTVKAKVKVEKFDGDKTDGKQPVEVKEFISEL
jgi:hypothetical protein